MFAFKRIIPLIGAMSLIAFYPIGGKTSPVEQVDPLEKLSVALKSLELTADNISFYVRNDIFMIIAEIDDVINNGTGRFDQSTLTAINELRALVQEGSTELTKIVSESNDLVNNLNIGISRLPFADKSPMISKLGNPVLSKIKEALNFWF